MSRYLGPKQKLSRREGCDLGLKSKKRSFDSKCKSKTKPGQQNKQASTRSSNYNCRFREKQKLKRIYGINEKQLTSYIRRAGSRGLNIEQSIMSALESRLDNVIYRLGFSATRAEARQLISHRFVLINDRTNNIPSCRLRQNDLIQLKKKESTLNIVRRALEMNKGQGFPAWLEFNMNDLSGRYLSDPTKEQQLEFINYGLVIEFYSYLL